jgi:HSP20 family protein
MSQEKPKKRTKVAPTTPGTSISKRKDQRELSRGFDDMFRDFRRAFDDLMTPFFPMATEIEQAAALPVRYAPLDLIDNGGSYTVKAELPGFTKDMVNVEVTKEGVSISAECKEEKEEKKPNYLHRERAYSAMQRYVAFPEEVMPGKADGAMKDGVLELKVPKKEPKPEEKPKKVELK